MFLNLLGDIGVVGSSIKIHIILIIYKYHIYILLILLYYIIYLYYILILE